MTTHSKRIDLVHYAIDSIGSGNAKPSRLILWLTDKELFSRLPGTLRRMQSRGLEIRLAEEFGPHSKYWPYVQETETFDMPLVTADDDVLYTADWLRGLVEAWRSSPNSIHCHRTRRIGMVGKEFTPYNTWVFGSDRVPSHLNFITGVGGVIYPPDFLAYLKRQGPAFADCCPTNDDIWLTVNAIRAGFNVTQVKDAAYRPVSIRGSQRHRLYTSNVLEGGNQVQWRRTIGQNEIDKLRIESDKHVGSVFAPGPKFHAKMIGRSVQMSKP